MNILIVEDEPMTASLLKSAIEYEINAIEYRIKIGVILVENGIEAMLELKRHKPDDRCILIISDVNMPGMDGYSLVENIRQDKDPEINTIPFWMYSASSALEDNVRLAIKKGVDKYIEKTDIREIKDEVILQIRRSFK